MKSANPAVLAFLEELRSLEGKKYEILQALREIVLACAPEASERMIYGGVMFSLSEDFCGLFAYKNHVSLEFGQGFLLRDAAGLLRGKGKFRRHLKFVALLEVQEQPIAAYIRQAVGLLDSEGPP